MSQYLLIALVFNECYHGSLDEALVYLDVNGKVALRCEFDSNPGLVKDAVARVVEFNDLCALEEALRHQDVACVLAEPVMTNCGMVLPEPGYHDKLRELATRYGANRMADGLEAAIEKHSLPWSVTRCGARAELQFMPYPPKKGSEAKAAVYWDLIGYTHLYLANRGVLVTPFHNMMLVSPVTTDADVDLLVKAWDDCMAELSAVARKQA